MRTTAPCGTYGGYLAHYKRKTSPCSVCKEAARTYRKGRYTPKTKTRHFSEAEKLEAFWAKTRVQGHCTVWAGSKKYNGYGEYRKKAAHRWIYIKCIGNIEPGKVLLHSCDNRLCVALQHLSPGSDALNARDALNKGRTTRGTKNAQAKLTWEQVREIRKNAKEFKIKEFAELYGVTGGTISGILLGRTWRE